MSGLCLWCFELMNEEEIDNWVRDLNLDVDDMPILYEHDLQEEIDNSLYLTTQFE